MAELLADPPLNPDARTSAAATHEPAGAHQLA
jgi:hypothetical protein